MFELALYMKVVSNMTLPLVEIISKLSFGVHERRDENIFLIFLWPVIG